MSTFARASTLANAAPDPTKHVHFELGMVLGRDDFMQEFAYHDGRTQWLARDLIGYGTVTGLRVSVSVEKGEPRIEVGPGVALSPLGQLIRVCSAQCAVLNDWLNLHKEDVRKVIASSSPLGDLKLYVVLCYRECLVEPVQIPGEPCRCEADAMAPSRIKDSFALDLRLTPPNQEEEDALRDFVDWLSRINISDTPAFSTPLDEFLAEVRKAAQGKSSPPDFMAGAPPAFVHIATHDADTYLRAAFRVWATELRPFWRPPGLGKVGCCADHQATDAPAVEECLLLAELEMTLAANGSLQVSDPQHPELSVTINEERRPYLLHLRFMQEWLLRGSRPSAGTPPLVNLSGDVTGDPEANMLRAIQGVPVVPPAGDGVLNDNFVLTFKDNAWQGAALPQPTATPNLSGDLSGPITDARVESIQGVKITITNPPPPNQVLTTQQGQLTLAPPGPLALGNDLTGLTDKATVIGIQDVPVNMAGVDKTKSVGNVLTYQGSEWRVLPVPAQPATGNFVEHPPQDPKTLPDPRFFIVAAGLVNGDGSDNGSYNGLTATATSNSLLRIFFNGYKNPDNQTSGHQYIVKVLPKEMDGVSTCVIVNFVRYETKGILLRVAFLDGRSLELDLLKKRQFMIEVSMYFVQRPQHS